MTFLIENWYVILGLVALVVGVIFVGYKFFNLPTEKQIMALKEWLKYAVVVAEKELGSGTGQLKLRKVYSMALEQFEWLDKIYTFEQFSKDVDIALEWLEIQLSSNKNINTVVKGE